MASGGNNPSKPDPTAAAIGAVAGVAAAAWGLYKWLGSSEPEAQSQGKMMKAPGRGYDMPRKDFEGSPRDYFRDLRGKK